MKKQIGRNKINISTKVVLCFDSPATDFINRMLIGSVRARWERVQYINKTNYCWIGKNQENIYLFYINVRKFDCFFTKCAQDYKIEHIVTLGVLA